MFCVATRPGMAGFTSCNQPFDQERVQAVKGTPTCYIFSCPQSTESRSPPFHGLIPYTTSREPGLILVAPSGEVRLWDSIGIGLAGGKNYSTVDLGLSDDEEVTNLIRSDVS